MPSEARPLISKSSIQGLLPGRLPGHDPNIQQVLAVIGGVEPNGGRGRTEPAWCEWLNAEAQVGRWQGERESSEETMTRDCQSVVGVRACRVVFYEQLPRFSL